MSSGGETIVESYNLFLNSDDAVNNGQAYDFQFGNNSITTRDKSQFIRLNLVNFNMYKNWTNVNGNNGGMVILSTAGTVRTPVILESQNYATLRDLAKNWADMFLQAALLVFVGVWGAASAVTSWTPDPGTTIDGTTNNVCSFLITTQNAHGLTPADVLAGNLSLQSVIDPTPADIGGGVGAGGDSALLLGGNRVAATALAGSYAITFPAVNQILVSGLYPGQRSSEPNVLVKLTPAPQVFASEAFDAPLTLTQESNLNPANIFAEIRIDTEMVQYEPTSDRIYFLNMYQKVLNHFRIALTDSRNRALPLFGVDQATIGNRHFTMTVRVDIVKGVAYGEPEIPTGHVKHQLPARMDSNMLVNLNNGKPGYGKPMGYG